MEADIKHLVLLEATVKELMQAVTLMACQQGEMPSVTTSLVVTRDQ